MLHFSRFKTTIILAVCVLGFLLAIPSVIKPGILPDWVPQPRVHLGLDLQGGSYLLMEVDAEAVRRDRLEQLTESIRTNLRQARINYRDLSTANGVVSVTIVNSDQVAAAQPLLAQLAAPEPGGVRAVVMNQDGTRFRLQLTEEGIRGMTSRAVEQAIEIVRRRIDETGVNEPQVAREGASRIVVQLPGLQDPGRIKRLLGQTAKMTFHLLDPEPTPGPGTKILPSADPTDPSRKYPVRTRVEVDGSHLRDAKPSSDSRGAGWVVNFTFDATGAKRFAEVSTANVGKPFAIVLDGKVISAPVIREPITGGQGQISGNFTAQSATELAVLLRAGALPAPLTILEERTVGPDLGADAIKAGLTAVVIGFFLVVAYMWLSYGVLGLFADIALAFNLFLTVAVLAVLEASLTLPGIAGILLTLGMAVDANILINERIREEARKGIGTIKSVEAGFSRAFPTIVDANLTTLIKMALLYAVGTGTIKGFAVTITFGILTSMFTATMLVRWFTSVWLRRWRPKQLKLSAPFRLVPVGTKISFMRGRFLGIGMSALISLASIVLFFHPGLNYGIDFAGGTVVELRTQGPANFEVLRDRLEKLNLGHVSLQQFGAPTDVLVRLERQQGGDQAQQNAVTAVKTMLDSQFPGTDIRRVESVGSSVSSELFDNGMLALGLAAIAMLIYITFRFEWQFGVGAVVTMFLDVTKTIGFFAVTGFQFNLAAIAAILAIMGFSINDKVVVYDRVRENLRLYRRMPLREVIDRSINETLSRTISTSFAIFLSLIPLALFAGEGLREFAWTLLFGLVLATSSSIFIAAPILLFLGDKRLHRGVEDEEAKPAASPAGSH